MNFTESFQEFSTKVGPTDLALYAGAGLVLWVLFKDKMSPVQKMVKDVVAKLKGLAGGKKDSVEVSPVVVPVIDNTLSSDASSEDVFFKLVVSWKQTRDLAVLSGCSEAVKVADQMFPHLSPNVCKKETKEAL